MNFSTGDLSELNKQVILTDIVKKKKKCFIRRRQLVGKYPYEGSDSRGHKDSEIERIQAELDLSPGLA